ncbi:MAG TPA: hypothetical protein VFG55_08395 [Rhodanobacteraceae bacterium]|nr:hypothetical protein [Rhodanobacteraceae bacterium]
MGKPETRKPTALAVGWLFAWVAAAGLASLSTAFADVGTGSASEPPALLQVALEPAANGPTGSVRQIGISGVWPTDCPPQVERVALDSADLTIQTRFPTTGCDASRATPYHLRLSPSAVAGLPQLPAQVYRTRVFLGTTTGVPELAAFTLLDATAVESAPHPESGFWWSQAGSESGAALAGSGLSLELQDHRVAVGLLGFDETGNATWYFGSAPLEGRVAHVPLVRLTRGDAPFAATGSRPLAEPGPRIEIEFVSPTRAQAYLVRDKGNGNLEVRALSVARSLFAANPPGSAWNGRWVLVREGEDNARVFDLRSLSTEDADSFHLIDLTSGASLDCRLDHATQASEPDLCTLSGDLDAVANFDQIGIDHLSGRAGDGAIVQLLRIPD